MTSGATVIIGLGNDYRRDDAVGLYIARQLGTLLPSGITIHAIEQPGLSLCDLWTEAERVIIIDAVSSGAPGGTIHLLKADDHNFLCNNFRSSSHSFGLSETVALARALNQLPKRMLIYGIEGSDFSFGTGLSDEVKPAAEQVTAQIRALLNS